MLKEVAACTTQRSRVLILYPGFNNWLLINMFHHQIQGLHHFSPLTRYFSESNCVGEGLPVQHQCGWALISLDSLVVTIVQVRLCEQTVSASFQYKSFTYIVTYSKCDSSCNQTFKWWSHPLEEFEAGVLFLISSRQITFILEPGFLPFHYSASLRI